MTRQFNVQIYCHNCGCSISAETSFGRWIRNNPAMPSVGASNCYCVIDQDYWVRQYITNGDKTYQMIMFVEVKTRSAEVTRSQRDFLHVVNQLMSNRQDTPTKKEPFFTSKKTRKVWSSYLNKVVSLRAYGAFVLTFENVGPKDSSWMKWNKRVIDENQLTSLLSFKIDPVTFEEIDLRSHHRTIRNLSLPLGDAA